MIRLLAALGCGLAFGAGLVISGMTQPDKVLGFLDVFGHWDPTLAIVMAAALAVTAPGFLLARRIEKPLLVPTRTWPRPGGIDRRLVAGAAIFGAGWGLIGLCPGPAIVNLATFSPRIGAFAAALAVGMVLEDFWRRRAANFT